jgi:pyrroloquinoline quinone (PQQ) biosynthesis protein C
VAVTKISVSLEEETLAAARNAAEEAGLSLSAWLSRAAQRATKLDAGLAAVHEYEAEAGAFTQEEIDRADEILDELGVRPATW